MAAPSDFHFGLVSAHNQNIAALANVNLDFSIVKFIPPPEYQEIGRAISPRRRKEAEDGQVHTVARKLVLLFCDGLPQIPNLVKAYGIRATEIAKNSNVNPRGTPLDGPFQEHVGIDGTSLRASATSGNGAVAIHLLACMLSRVFKGRATAIWTEMVVRRKAMLQEKLSGDNFSIDEVTAAAIQITRDQLSEWDASARAWLESADIAFSRNQTQTRLILDNLSLDLPSSPDIYEAVTSIWRVALEFMEKTVLGVQQAVKSGEVLLALSSWHLYPDLEVLLSHTRSIKQNDPLIAKGGVVTVGLQNPNASNELGISWSLPLSYLKYYGTPVISIGCINEESSRVTMEQLLLVAFGCVTKGWVKDTKGTALCARFMLALQKVLDQQEPPNWLNLLFGVASSYLKSTGKSREDADRLISFGRRRCAKFLDQSADTIPKAFGLTRPDAFIGILKDAESKIAQLRGWFDIQKRRPELKSAEFNTSALEPNMILYPVDNSQFVQLKSDLKNGKPSRHNHVHRGWEDIESTPSEEWASIVPLYSDKEGRKCHRRWLSKIRQNSDLKYERIGNLAVMRKSQLELETNETCGFLFPQDDQFAYGTASTRKIDMYDIYISWPQSHFEKSSAALLQGYQLPKSPALSTANAVDVIVDDHLSTRRANEDGDLGVRESEKAIPRKFTVNNPVKKEVLPSGPQRFFGIPLLRFLVLASNVEREKEMMSRIIKRELDSNPAYKNLKWQTQVTPPEDGPQRLEHPIGSTHSNHAQRKTSEISEGIVPASKKRVKKGTAPAWDCMSPLSANHCLYMWYIQAASYWNKLGQRYVQVFAEPGGVGIYTPHQVAVKSRNVLHSLDISLEEVTEVLEGQNISSDALQQYFKGTNGFESLWNSLSKTWISSLQGLDFAAEVYLGLPDARVELSITKNVVKDYHWATPTDEDLSYARALSCIATCESGDLNIKPASLKQVMAISVGSSLYTTSFLSSDPFTLPSSHMIRRSVGNIGKKGIAFLISPNGAIVKEPEYDSWRSVQHNEFNGKFENNFPETSLHLSFTGYELPLDTGRYGLRDKEAYFLEAVVGAYERGTWVADLDILGSLYRSSDYVKRLEEQCEHTLEEASNITIGTVTAIDCWAELLDAPETPSIVRCTGNWSARLATAAVSIQKRRPVLIAREKVCWACIPCDMTLKEPLVTIIC